MSSSSIYLLEAGEIIFSESPVYIRTILGSCVSATFFDLKTGTSAMMHGLYPGKGKSAVYTETAIEMIIEEYKKKDIRLGRVEVKLFGGAKMNIISGEKEISNAIRIRNVESARTILSEYNVKIKAEDTGCACGREVIFNTDTGVVYVRKINSEETCKSPYCLEKDIQQCPRR